MAAAAANACCGLKIADRPGGRRGIASAIAPGRGSAGPAAAAGAIIRFCMTDISFSFDAIMPAPALPGPNPLLPNGNGNG